MRKSSVAILELTGMDNPNFVTSEDLTVEVDDREVLVPCEGAELIRDVSSSNINGGAPQEWAWPPRGDMEEGAESEEHGVARRIRVDDASTSRTSRGNGPAESQRMSEDGSIASTGSGHCHDDFQQEVVSRRAEKVLWLVAVLSLIFICVEAAGGAIANSLAIITDAGHLLSDLLSFIISIVAIRTARHPASKRLSFGYHRAEIIGATISIVILWVLTTVLVLLAVERIVENKLEVEADTMLITAGAGVAFNIIMAIVLHLGAHTHSHGGMSHSHAHGHSHGNDQRNVNVRAAFIHVVGDLVQSLGVLVAALIIKFTGWQLADPICTFLFSIIVLFTTITVLRDIFYVLMEATPPHVDYAALRQDLLKIDNVCAVHDLHVWSLNMEKVALSVHLAIRDSDKAVDTVSEARQHVMKRYQVHLVTIQVEPYDKSMTSCGKCQPV